MSAWKPDVFGRFAVPASPPLPPAVHPAPADLALGRQPFAKAFGDVAGLRRKVSAISSVFAVGSLAQSATLAAESIRTTPPWPMPISRSLPGNAAGLAHHVDKRCALRLAPHGRAAADRRPDWRHDRADFQVRARNLVGQPLQISSVGRVDAVCADRQGKSTPSNLLPSTSAAAVRSSIVSRPIGGSESGPLPTRPGHIALCSCGKLLRPSTMSSSHSQCCP